MGLRRLRPPGSTPTGSTPLALGRLLRVSLSVSAAADVLAGIVVGAGTWPGGWEPWACVAASLGVYHGGLVLNDWADRGVDARTRPERPIPSGAVPAGLALGLALVLLASGPLLGASVAPSLALGYSALAAVAAYYDLAGRGPWIGPLCLALCRAGNLGLGLAAGRLLVDAPALEPLALGAPALYGLYVFWVSRLGRMEDAEDDAPLGRRPARIVAVLAALLLALPILPLPPADTGGAPDWLESARVPLASLVCAVGAFGLLRLAFRQGDWSRGAVLRTMGIALRRLLVFTGALALVRGSTSGLVVGTGILCGLPLIRALRTWFPPS